MCEMTPRPPFSASPRHEPPLTVRLNSRIRNTGALQACFRRAAASPRLYTRADKRVWRWLFMPCGVPTGLANSSFAIAVVEKPVLTILLDTYERTAAEWVARDA